MSASQEPRIWVEIGDLLRFFRESSTPAGIARIQLEILPHLLDLAPERVALFQVGGTSREIEFLGFDEVLKRCDNSAFLAKMGQMGRLYDVAQFLRQHLRNFAADLRLMVRRGDRGRFAEVVRPGDIVLNLGSSWSHRNFGRSIGELKRDYGVRFALLIHDVLPLAHRAFVSRSHRPLFDRWFADMAAVWDVILTPSFSSAREIRESLEQRGMAVPPIHRIGFGSGFTQTPMPPEPAARTHVLYVSTIEIRKNHRLLFDVWQRLIADHGAAAVPDLVFAGRFGWEIADLKRDLAASAYLDGKIRVIENLDDAELAAQYRAAHFTVFPSLCEGWGLPIGESLYFGRYCIAADATSIPEVGGVFVDYHPPRDVAAARRLIEAALFEPGVLAEKERRIREEFHPRTWRDTARDILRALGATPKD